MNKLLVTAFCCLMGSSGTAFAQSPPMAVTAWAKHFGGRIVYTYDVQNLGAAPLSRFWIGSSAGTDGKPGVAELSVSPASANSSFWLSADVSQSPEGWGVLLDYPGESSTFSLQWVEAGYFFSLWPKAPRLEAPQPPTTSRDIASGATATGFTVALPAADIAYVRGHAAVFAGDGWVSVPLRRGDLIAPSVSLTVSRLNQNGANGEWAIFEVAYAATDNFDPLPTTDFSVLSMPSAAPGDVLVSRAASAWNVKLRNVPGRVYTLRAQSIDASGNIGFKTYTYAVGAR